MGAERTERPNPARSMRLMWGLEETSSRGPKPKLALDDIVAVAIELADDEGFEALSMRRLAERLDVGAMTLYTYVESKDDLLDLMYDRIVGEAHRRVEGAVAGQASWRDRLELIARDRWDVHRRHHWFIRVPWTRTPLGPNILDAYEAAVAVLAGLGLTGKEVNDILTLVSAYVDGAAKAAVEAVTLPAATAMDDDEWWAGVSEVLDHVWDEKRFPFTSSPGMASAWEEPDDDVESYFLAEATSAFEFGLARVLDSIQAYVADVPADRPPTSTV